MIKYVSFIFLVSITISGQVGINTRNPKATLEIVPNKTDGSTPEGLLAPRLTGDQVKMADSQYGSEQAGAIIYVTIPVTSPSSKTTAITSAGYYFYDGNTWKPLFSSLGGINADCNTNSFEGNYLNGVPMDSDNKFSILITNNSFSTASISFSTSDLVLTGVSGLSVSGVSPSSVILNSGDSQQIKYNLTGTPSSSGIISAKWTKLALNCIKTISVSQPALISGTLDCTGITNNGALNPGVSASGVYSVISYSGGNGGGYSAQSIASTGVTGLTATLTPGILANGSGALTYVITGTPSGNGAANFAINIGGQTCTLVRGVGCGAFVAPGEWKELLCHNLGADTSLNPHDMSQNNVWGLNGAYIQWGKRGPDTTGDSRVDWQTALNDGDNGFVAAPTESSLAGANDAAISGWSQTPAPDYSWRASDGTKTANDPCPSGYRVPTKDEWVAITNNNIISRSGVWVGGATNYGSAIHYGPNASTKQLTLPAAGFYDPSDGSLHDRGITGAYWSSTEYGSGDAHRIDFSVDYVSPLYFFSRLTGFSVRCIAE